MKKKQDETTAIDNVPVPQEAIPETPQDNAPVVPVEDADSAVQGKQSEKSLTVAVDLALDAFVEWAKSDVAQDDLEPFVQLDLLDKDHALTDKGCELLDVCNVPYRFINFLELGTPVTFIVDNQNFTVGAGSRMRVLHNGQDRDGMRYSVCDAGDFLPNAQIYKNSNHKDLVMRYPMSQPLATEYKTGS